MLTDTPTPGGVSPGEEEEETDMTVNTVKRMIPKDKKPAIHEVFEDQDGFWIILNEGWNADGIDSKCRTIHCGGEEFTEAETVEDLKYQISQIRKL